MYFTGIIIAVCTFLTIGIWHPIVIKTEYYWGTRPWIVYLIIGLAAIIGALFIENTVVSAIASNRKSAWRGAGFPRIPNVNKSGVTPPVAIIHDYGIIE